MFYIWLFVLLAAGGVVLAVSGFGVGIVAMAMLSFLISDVTEAASIVMAASMASVIMLSWRYRKSARFKILIAPILAYFAVMPPSAKLSAGIGPAASGWLGVALMVMALYYLRFEAGIRLPSTWPAGAAAGALTGFINGMFSMGGPPIGLYLMSATESKEVYLGTIQFYFLINNTYDLTVRGLTGHLTVRMLPAILVGAVGVTLGTLAGSRLFDRLPDLAFRRIVYSFVFASGVWLVVKAWLL